MEHNHSIIDTDKHFIIDTETRAITNEKSGEIVMMQGDHNAERFTFELPERHIEEHDMSLCDTVRVHYLNVCSNNKDVSTGIYEVNDVKVSEDDENKITFSWLISGNATKYAGALTFIIEFQCHNGDEIIYEWNTARHTGINIGEGMDNAEEVITRNVDILAEWNARLYMQATANEKSIAEFREEVNDVNAYLSEMDAKYGNIVQFGDYIDENGELILTKTTDEKTLRNSYAGGIKITPYGNTERDGTTGAQLANLPDIAETTVNGIKWSCKNGVVKAVGTTTGANSSSNSASLKYDFPIKAGTYYISGSKGNVMVYAVVEKTGTANVIVNDKSFELDGTETLCRIFCQINTSGVTVNETIYPMLNAGTEALPWEKFTGGQASPNPDYPCEIKPVKGKNELDCRGLVEQTIGGGKITPVYDEHGNLLYVEVNGTFTSTANYALNKVVLQDGDYRCTGCPSGGTTSSYELCFANEYRDYGSGRNITVESGKELQPFIIIREGYTANNVRFYPMIRKATIADDTYVPYGLLRFKAKNKNLLNMAGAVSGKNNGVEVTINNDGSYSFVGTATNKHINVWLLGQYLAEKVLFVLSAGTYYVKGVNLYDFSQGTYKSVVEDFAGRNGTIVTFENDQPITGVRAIDAVAGTTYDEIVYPIIAKSDVPVEWQPYTENSITLSEPIELNGINDVRDGIVEKDGVYGVERKFALGQITRVTNLDSKGVLFVTDTFGDAVNYLEQAIAPLLLCESFVPYSLDAVRSKDYGITLYGVKFSIANKDWNYDVATANAALAENPITVLYELAEPVFEPLPTADQIALRSLMSYDGVTYVSCDSEVEPLIVTKYGTSEVGALSLHNENLTAANKLLSDAKIEEINSNLNGFVNVYMFTGNGFSTMAKDIYDHWGEIKSETGGIKLNNGATLFHGTYHKYSEAMGSMLLHETGEDNVYVWRINNGTYSIDTVALNSDLGGFMLYDLGQINISTNAEGYAIIQLPFNVGVGYALLTTFGGTNFVLPCILASGNTITVYVRNVESGGMVNNSNVWVQGMLFYK